MRNSILKFIFPAFIILLSWSYALAQPYDRKAVSARQATIAQIAKNLDLPNFNIGESRETLRTLKTDIQKAITELEKKQSEITIQLESIGPAPEAGKSETADVASRRKTLLSESTETAALLTQAKLNAADTTRLLEIITTLQRNAFVKETFKSSQSPLALQFWRDAAAAYKSLRTQLGLHIAQIKAPTSELALKPSDYIRLIIGILSLLFAFNPLRRVFNRISYKAYQLEAPDWENRLTVLGFQIISRFIPALIGLFLIFSFGTTSGIITSGYIPTAKMLAYTFLLSFVAAGAAKAILDSGSLTWRIIPLTTPTARRAGSISIFAVLIWGLDQAIFQTALSQPDYGPLANTSALVLSILTASLIWFSVKRLDWSLLPHRSEDISLIAKKRWKGLRALGLPLAGLIIILALLGYLNFARLISGRIVLIIGFIIGIWLSRKSIALGLQAADKLIFPIRDTQVIPSSRRSIHFWAGLIMDVIIGLMLIPITLLLIGRTSLEVKSFMLDAFTGITIGKFTVSISDILAALLTFFVIIMVTRFLQKSLDARLFSKDDMEDGFRNSFRTLLGYVGLILAIFSAISVIGLDLSKLAIIAGALSVGIGFGLQSIVNNFVSGLILLFERPVKVGDWVITSAGEGFIKNISVRSTEIETFDRASIIVPNSELISSSVTNWTHKDKSGRVIIPVGVAYSSDAKKVRDILLALTKSHSKILKNPEPIVYFSDFGGSSLDLELRFFIRNIAESPLIKNDLRFDILEAFRDNNIEIPFPQSDITIKNWEVKP